MKFLKKKNQDEIIFKDGMAEAERRLIPIWKQKLDALRNEKDEEIEGLTFEITRLQIQLKNQEETYKESIERETNVRQRESMVKRDENKIKRFKEDVREEIMNVMAKNQEKFQTVLRMLGENEKIEG